MTVLLWGNTWWLPGGGSVAFPSLNDAAATLAEHFRDEPKPIRLRLIYQPEHLESVTTPCPNGSRSKLAAALGEEFPALAEENGIWSHEPVLGLGDGFTTLLHYEREPWLLKLGKELAERGLCLESAWPLSTFLSYLPVEWSISGAVTVVAMAGKSALAHHHPPTGGPAVKRWTGEAIEQQVTDWLAAPGVRDPNGLVLILKPKVEDEDPFLSYDRLSLGDALGRSVAFPRNHPAQLLPADPKAYGPMLAVAASVLLLISASVMGWQASQGWERSQHAAQMLAREKAELRAEIARNQANEPEVRILRAAIAGPGTNPPAADLLERVAQTIPRELALSRIALETGQIRIEGFAAPGAPADTVSRWQAALVEPRWVFTGPPVLRAPGEFVLAGTFAR